ncbi:thioredoxin [Candidatus Marinamargulisbacteria bacterium SCGC AG-333-B06]|nr:thioredoxin [Candidatus Marinamargulisbacteria bacterium SCGC AG-333-B06]
MPTKQITDSSFNDQLTQAGSKLVVVDFWADWCGPCKMLAPTLESISDKLADSIEVFKLNTDENPKTAQDFQITSIPCCILFKDSQEVHRIIGHKPEDAFEAELSPFL